MNSETVAQRKLKRDLKHLRWMLAHLLRAVWQGLPADILSWLDDLGLITLSSGELLGMIAQWESSKAEWELLKREMRKEDEE